MKKSAALSLIKEQKIRDIVGRMSRGNFYEVLTPPERDGLWTNMAILIGGLIRITHFQRGGIRVGIFRYPDLYAPRAIHLLYKTVSYGLLDKFPLKKVSETDLPLYMDRATPLMERWFRQFGRTN